MSRRRLSRIRILTLFTHIRMHAVGRTRRERRARCDFRASPRAFDARRDGARRLSQTHGRQGARVATARTSARVAFYVESRAPRRPRDAIATLVTATRARKDD